MNRIGAWIFAAVFLLPGVVGSSLAQVDADAALALARRNDCFKCHAIDVAKKAPAYRRIAARLRTKPDAIETIIEHITAGATVQLQDGSDVQHRIVDTRDPAELDNLARWILSL